MDQRKKTEEMSSDNLVPDVLRAMRRILRRTSEYSKKLSRQSGLTLSQLLCLRIIAESASGEEITAAQVSHAVHLSPATVSRIVDRLEAAGLVTRQRGRQDRRKVWLSITPIGRQKLKDLPTPLQDQLVRRLTSLPLDEQREILAALERLVDMMEARDLDAAPLLEPGVEVKPAEE